MKRMESSSANWQGSPYRKASFQSLFTILTVAIMIAIGLIHVRRSAHATEPAQIPAPSVPSKADKRTTQTITLIVPSGKGPIDAKWDKNNDLAGQDLNNMHLKGRVGLKLPGGIQVQTQGSIVTIDRRNAKKETRITIIPDTN